MDYKFTTRSVFLFGQFLKHFEGELDEVIELVDSLQGLKPGDDVMSKISVPKVMALVVKVVGSASKAEETAIELVSHAVQKSVSEVREMDGYEFMLHLRQYMQSINWGRFLGESLGLILQVSKNAPAKQSQENQSPILPEPSSESSQS